MGDDRYLAILLLIINQFGKRAMTIIRQSDFIDAIEQALQYISYYHPSDFIQAMHGAYEREESVAAKNAIAQILVNSRLSALGKRPICQDTGIVCAFVKIGMGVQFDKTNLTIQEMVNEGTRRAYANQDNVLRASVVTDPLGKRQNTQDNTPAVVHIEMVQGDKIDVEIAAKGGGSEFKSKFQIINPSDSLVDWVLPKVLEMGAGWCPPGILGIGVGGTAEKAMLLAKESLNEPIDMHELLARGPKTRAEELRIELFEKVNALGVGAQGLGGLTTVLDVKINDFPTHIACLPVAMIPNCAATRHVHFELDGSGVPELATPDMEAWPEISFHPETYSRRVNLDTLTEEEMKTWKTGETLLISGKVLTARDAAHKRLVDMAQKGEPLPVNLKNRFIYYVGPVDPVRDEVIGPAGPTTATRMDKFTEFMLGDCGVMGLIGKAERGPGTVELIQKYQKTYMIAVGGAAYLISKAIKSSKILAFEDLGTEAIRELEVIDMPVTIAVDSEGQNIHRLGPKQWAGKFQGIAIQIEK